MWWSKDTGCTACMVLITPTKIICANIGDSRACMKTKKGTVALSTDHKPDDAAEYQRIKKYGLEVTEQRVGGILAVSRAFGDYAFKRKPVLAPAGQAVTCVPDFVERARSADDEYIVIACDGIWDVKGNQVVTDYMDAKFKAKPLKEWPDLTDPIEEMLDEI